MTAPFSLVAGGPLYRVMSHLGVVGRDGRGALRAGALFAAVTWLPLLGMSLVAMLATGSLPSLVIDYAVHVRLLVAIPLFFVAERSLSMRTGRCVDELLRGRWVEDGEEAIPRLTAQAERWRDAAAPEIVCLTLALLGSQMVLGGVLDFVGVVRGRHLEAHLSPLTVWYSLVALPAFQFLTYRWLWRWCIWSRLLWSLSRLRLRPSATHPDRRGGLAFLTEPAVGYSYVVLGVSSVQAGVWADRVSFAQAELASFRAPLVVMLVAAQVVTLGPLLVFWGVLWRARFTAVREYGRLALELSRLFHARWIDGSGREGLLGSQDPSTMADLGTEHGVILQMWPVPFGWRDMTIIAAAVVLPVVPVILIRIPLLDLIRKLGSVALGGLPG